MASNKINGPLRMALEAYRAGAGKDRPDDDSITVTLTFTGPIADVEAQGFEVHHVEGDKAYGAIRFRDIDRFQELPNVLRLTAGAPRTNNLDTAVRQVGARASTAENASYAGDGLWHVRDDAGGGSMRAVANATGEGVIIAVIDSGIDFGHPAFMKNDVAPRQTRILRIWDQGLTPVAANDPPDAALLLSDESYGIEYTDDDINKALGAGPGLLHRDYTGHGTHVAAIAAGGRERRRVTDAARNIGVAPDASLIAVKVFDTPDKIKYHMPPADPGGEVDYDRRFRDAMLYCLRMAKKMGEDAGEPPKPLVICMSFGSNTQPGDALNDEARWIDARFDSTAPASDMNFPRRAVMVKSIGNDGNNQRVDSNGNWFFRQTGRIVMPASGEVTIPFSLRDTRGGVNYHFNNGVTEIHSPWIRIVFWYRALPNPNDVRFALRIPNAAAGFTSDKRVGEWWQQRMVPPRGSGTQANIMAYRRNEHMGYISHENVPAVQHPGDGVHPPQQAHRRKVDVYVAPQLRGGTTVSYYPGVYEVRIRAPQGTEFFVQCGLGSWARDTYVWFEFSDTMADGTTSAPSNPIVNFDPKWTAADTLGRAPICVGSYDDTNSTIATSSSRGPVRSYLPVGSALGPLANKPDLGAPGVDIDSAQSSNTRPTPFFPFVPYGYVEKSGASMATPMVAGAAALLLHKDPSLTPDQIRQALQDNARDGAVPPVGNPRYQDAFGAGMLDILKAHKNL